jgi:hypothetical protein
MVTGVNVYVNPRLKKTSHINEIMMFQVKLAAVGYILTRK